MITFPVLLLIGFILHPDLFSFKVIHEAQELAANFRHQPIFHIGHLLVAISIPFIILSNFYILLLLRKDGSSYGFWGGCIALLGSVVLALDKGSLCLVLSGFDTLDTESFQVFAPYLQVLVDKKGLLMINWLIILLPIGTIIQTIRLMKEKYFSKRKGVLVIIGLTLLNNPDIELISTIGVICMMVGFISLGRRVLNKEVQLNR